MRRQAQPLFAPEDRQKFDNCLAWAAPSRKTQAKRLQCAAAPFYVLSKLLLMHFFFMCAFDLSYEGEFAAIMHVPLPLRFIKVRKKGNFLTKPLELGGVVTPGRT